MQQAVVASDVRPAGDRYRQAAFVHGFSPSQGRRIENTYLYCDVKGKLSLCTRSRLQEVAVSSIVIYCVNLHGC